MLRGKWEGSMRSIIVAGLVCLLEVVFGAPVQAQSNDATVVKSAVHDWFAADAQLGGQYIRTGAENCVRGRDLICECPPAHRTFQGYETLPVVECDYNAVVEGKTTRTRAYMLFPSADQLAFWVVNACVDAHASDLRLCAGRLSSAIWTASNGQFVVAGFVVEPAQSATWRYPHDPYCFLFRDGVTITTHNWPSTRHAENGVCGEDAVNDEAVATALRFGRIASTTRGQYHSVGGADPVDAANWPAAVGHAFRDAWRSDRNLLLRARVAGLNKCDGNIFETPRIPANCH
jgi:hypothetical protein